MTLTVNGFVAKGFEPVRDAFARNWERHGEVGAACAVYRHGQPVVDIWGGHRDAESGAPWEEDTVVWVASTTKGLTATCANLLIQRGEIDVDAPVADYWPEFKAAGKESIPVRWLLCHKAGVPLVDKVFTRDEVAAWDPVVDALAAQRPEWEPGTAYGYHGMTYGFLVGEVIRRVSGRRPSQFFADEIAAPLGLDTHIGLRPEFAGRLARTVMWTSGFGASGADMAALVANSSDEVKAAMGAMSDPNALFPRIANFSNPPVDYADPSWLAIEMPAATGVSSAHSLARMYASLVSEVDGVRLLTAETVARARTSQTDGDGLDRVMNQPVKWGLGYSISGEAGDMLAPGSFGHAGAGGSIGFADPESGIGFGYVMNKLAEPYLIDAEKQRIEINRDNPAKDLVAAVRAAL